jgi:hypothetical protein
VCDLQVIGFQLVERHRHSRSDTIIHIATATTLVFCDVESTVPRRPFITAPIRIAQLQRMAEYLFRHFRTR